MPQYVHTVINKVDGAMSIQREPDTVTNVDLSFSVFGTGLKEEEVQVRLNIQDGQINGGSLGNGFRTFIFGTEKMLLLEANARVERYRTALELLADGDFKSTESMQKQAKVILEHLDNA